MGQDTASRCAHTEENPPSHRPRDKNTQRRSERERERSRDLKVDGNQRPAKDMPRGSVHSGAALISALTAAGSTSKLAMIAPCSTHARDLCRPHP